MGNWPPQGYLAVGKVVDSAQQKAIGSAAIELISVTTGKIVDGTLTDSVGQFLVKTPQSGKYKITILALGFKEFTSPEFVLSDSVRFLRLGKIILLPAKSTNTNVVINAPLIENDADKLVYNAAQDLSSKGGTATDVLRKTPMVEVDLDGNVSVRGSRNIRIFINGKPSGMLATSPREALQAIPADQIERVEVITNPSAKYDAEGTAGIINLITKAQKIKGQTGFIHAGAGNRSGNLGANLSLQNGKHAFTIALGGYYWYNIGDGEMNRLNTIGANTFELKQKSENKTLGGGPYSSISYEYSPNKFFTVTASGSLRGNFMKGISNWNAETGLANSTLSYLYGRETDNFTLGLGYDGNLDFRKTFKNKKDRELGLSLQYTGNSSSVDYHALQKNNLGNKNYEEKSNNLGLNNEYTIQLDFTEPITQKLKIETGAKTIFRKVTSKYEFDSLNFMTNEYRPIVSRENNFYYNQNVLAGYFQGSYSLSKTVSLRLGARYEFTTFGGGFVDSNTSFKGKPYQNLIPFVSVNKKMWQTGFLRIQYTHRLLRPSLFYLNPYTNYSDPRNLTTGNPQLEAEVSYNAEISAGKYTQKGGGRVAIYSRNTNNAIETIRDVDAMGVYSTTYGNIGVNNTVGMDLNLNLRRDKYNINFNGGMGAVFIRSTSESGITAGQKNKGFTYSAGLHGFYKISKRFSVEAFARVNAPSFSLQGRSTNWYFHSIGIKRRFKNDKGGIGLGVDNPFTPHVVYKTETSGPGFTFSDRRDINMLGVRVNFDYRFGKIEFEQMPKEKKGIKNDDLKQGESQQGGS